MPVYQCDLCQEEVARLSVSDMETGSVLFVGMGCAPMFGLTLTQGLEGEVLDAALKTIGYQPSKALRDARKAEEVPEYDPNRSIAAVVESAPRIDTGESVSPDSDESTDQPSDLSTDQPAYFDGEVIVGEATDGRPITQPRADDGADEDPPY